jgi:hypothetical protein
LSGPVGPAVTSFKFSFKFVTFKRSTLDLPNSVGHNLRHLSRNHDPKIAFSSGDSEDRRRHGPHASGSILLPRTEDRKDLARSGETAKVLAGTIGENDSAYSRYQAGLCNDIQHTVRRDGRLITMTEFTSNILALINRSWLSSRRISRSIVVVWVVGTSRMLPRNSSSPTIM